MLVVTRYEGTTQWISIWWDRNSRSSDKRSDRTTSCATFWSEGFLESKTGCREYEDMIRYVQICREDDGVIEKYLQWSKQCVILYLLHVPRELSISTASCFFVEQALQKKMNEAALDPVLVAGGTRTLQLWVYVGLEFRTVFDLLYSACMERVQNLLEICMGSRCFPKYGPESDPNWPELIHVRT